jgi:hypothetical protein
VAVEQSVIDWCSGCACPFPTMMPLSLQRPFVFATSALPLPSHLQYKFDLGTMIDDFSHFAPSCSYAITNFES